MGAIFVNREANNAARPQMMRLNATCYLSAFSYLVPTAIKKTVLATRIGRIARTEQRDTECTANLTC